MHTFVLTFWCNSVFSSCSYLWQQDGSGIMWEGLGDICWVETQVMVQQSPLTYPIAYSSCYPCTVNVCFWAICVARSHTIMCPPKWFCFRTLGSFYYEYIFVPCTQLLIENVKRNLSMTVMKLNCPWHVWSFEIWKISLHLIFFSTAWNVSKYIMLIAQSNFWVFICTHYTILISKL
jgi:hypothetical protein